MVPLELEDWPTGPPCRGLMLDVSRDRVPTMQALEALVAAKRALTAPDEG